MVYIITKYSRIPTEIKKIKFWNIFVPKILENDFTDSHDSLTRISQSTGVPTDFHDWLTRISQLTGVPTDFHDW